MVLRVLAVMKSQGEYRAVLTSDRKGGVGIRRASRRRSRQAQEGIARRFISCANMCLCDSVGDVLDCLRAF